MTYKEVIDFLQVPIECDESCAGAKKSCKLKHFVGLCYAEQIKQLNTEIDSYKVDNKTLIKRLNENLSLLKK